MTRPLRTAILVATFLASFLACSAVVRAALGWPDVSGVRKKAVYYESDPDGFDVLFVGSSNVMNSIQPEVFDAGLAARGYELRSYNLGLPGMLPFETDFMLRQVLAERTPRLRWVIVELADWKPSLRLAEKTSRSVYWHSLASVAAMADAAFHHDEMDTWDRLTFVGDHLELALWRLTNFGRAQEELAIELGVRADDGWNGLIDPTREGGYVALEESGNAGAVKGRRRFLANEGADWQGVLEQRRRTVPSGAPPEYLVRAAAHRLAWFEGTGVELIHVLPASISVGELGALGPPGGPLSELWDFSGPDEYPALFDLRVRYDDRHLQRAGAEIMTRLLARRFADHLDAAASR